MDQKLTMLSKVPLFAGLGPAGLTEVGRLADEVSVDAGKVLTKEGSVGHEFFVILDGSVAISKGGQVVNDMGEGEFFGELALLGNIPRTATATASRPTRVLVIGHREFTSLLDAQPAIREEVMRAVAHWIAELAPDRAT